MIITAFLLLHSFICFSFVETMIQMTKLVIKLQVETKRLKNNGPLDTRKEHNNYAQHKQRFVRTEKSSPTQTVFFLLLFCVVRILIKGDASFLYLALDVHLGM